MSAHGHDPELVCRQFVELVTPYIEGALDPATQEDFEQHLAYCEGCVHYLGQINRTRELIAGTAPRTTKALVADDQLLQLFRGWALEGP